MVEGHIHGGGGHNFGCLHSPFHLSNFENWRLGQVEQPTGTLGRVKEVVRGTAEGWGKSPAAFPWLALGFLTMPLLFPKHHGRRGWSGVGESRGELAEWIKQGQVTLTRALSFPSRRR